MQGIALAVSALAFLSAVGSMGLFLFLWGAFRSPLVSAYLGYLGAYLASSAWSLFGQALSLVRGPFGLPDAAWYFPNVLFLAAYTVAAPNFILRFAGLPYGRARKSVMGALAALSLALSPLCFFGEEASPLRFIPSIVSLLGFLVSILSSQASLIGAYKRVEDRLFRIGVPALLAYNLICVGGGMADSFASSAQLAAGLFPWGLLFQPLSLLAWNVLAFLWILRFHADDLVRKPLAGLKGSGDANAVRDLGLTEREIELAGLLAEGQANKGIAGRLGLSEHTVRNHIHNIFVKTGARNRVELARKLWGGGVAP